MKFDDKFSFLQSSMSEIQPLIAGKYWENNIIIKCHSVCLKNPKILFYGLYFSFILYYSAF